MNTDSINYVITTPRPGKKSKLARTALILAAAFSLLAIGGITGATLFSSPVISSGVNADAKFTASFKDRPAVFYYLQEAPEVFDEKIEATVVEYGDELMLMYQEDDAHTHLFESKSIGQLGLQVGQVVDVYVVYID